MPIVDRQRYITGLREEASFLDETRPSNREAMPDDEGRMEAGRIEIRGQVEVPFTSDAFGLKLDGLPTHHFVRHPSSVEPHI